MSKQAVVENIATMAATAATTIGMYALGAGSLSLVGFVFLLNLNYIRKKGA